MNKQYYYLGKEEALRHQSMVYAVSQEPIEFYKELLGGNAIEFYTDNLPYYVTVEGDSVREATELELYKAGIYELTESEFIHGEKILNVNDFEIPVTTIKPVFDYQELKWVEAASQEEIDTHIWKLGVTFYNQELEFASRAVTELMCNIISPEDFNAVKDYMRAIDPYASSKRTRSLRVPRPEIFKRYV